MAADEALRAIRAAMVTREQAIRNLLEAELIAQPRDWGMGETIQIFSRLGMSEHNGVRSYAIGGYLCPDGDEGAWLLLDGGSFVAARFDALLLAVRGAIIWFTGLEASYLASKRKGLL